MNKKLLLTIVGVATLLIAVVGATFAYFASTMNNGAKNITVGTAQVSNVVLTNEMIGMSDILPGYESASYNINASASIKGNVTVPYTCKISQSSESLVDLEYLVVAGSGMSSTVNNTWTSVPMQPTTFLTGTLSSSSQSQTSTIKFRLHETGSNQTAGQSGVNSTVTVACTLNGGGSLYYNAQNPNGTSDEIAGDFIYVAGYFSLSSPISSDTPTGSTALEAYEAYLTSHDILTIHIEEIESGESYYIEIYDKYGNSDYHTHNLYSDSEYSDSKSFAEDAFEDMSGSCSETVGSSINDGIHEYTDKSLTCTAPNGMSLSLSTSSAPVGNTDMSVITASKMYPVIKVYLNGNTPTSAALEYHISNTLASTYGLNAGTYTLKSPLNIDNNFTKNQTILNQAFPNLCGTDEYNRYVCNYLDSEAYDYPYTRVYLNQSSNEISVSQDSTYYCYISQYGGDCNSWS